MTHIKDITGQRFFRLTVTRRAEDAITKSGAKVVVWECLCDCGNTILVRISNLRNGTKSCGCWRTQFPRANKSHGKTHTRIYSIWNQMIQRCTNPNHISFPNYGGRGISVCDRWQLFANFYADMGDIPDGCSIDRIDNEGDYEPKNCKWATKSDQSINRRNNRRINHNGLTLTVKEWSETTNIPAYTITNRIDKLQWPIQKALSTPVRTFTRQSPSVSP